MEFTIGGDEIKQSFNEFNSNLWASSFKDLLNPDYKEAVKCMPELTTTEWAKIWNEQGRRRCLPLEQD